MAMGTCFAKITHSGKIHLQITCVDHLAKHALHKVWLKASAENSFLYGNHVTKQGLGRITDAAPQHGGAAAVCPPRQRQADVGLPQRAGDDAVLQEPHLRGLPLASMGAALPEHR